MARYVYMCWTTCCHWSSPQQSVKSLTTEEKSGFLNLGWWHGRTTQHSRHDVLPVFPHALHLLPFLPAEEKRRIKRGVSTAKPAGLCWSTPTFAALMTAPQARRTPNTRTSRCVVRTEKLQRIARVSPQTSPQFYSASLWRLCHVRLLYV